MKTFKKYISLLLAVLMITTSFPLMAFGDELQDISGSDENVEWSYTAQTDTLYIDGENICLEDYGAYPTFIDGEYVDVSFSHLVIGNNVKSIKLNSSAQKPNYNNPYYSKRFDITFEDNSSLEEIGDYAFYGSSAISMTLPESVTSISSSSFTYAMKLEYLDMSNTAITALPNGAFQCCFALREIKLPSGIKAIPNNCFEGLSSALTTVEIPDSVKTIGSYAFNGCSKLQLDKLPSSLTTVGDSAFYECSSVSFDLNTNVTNISQYAFAYSGVRNVNLSVNTISKYTFYRCYNLKKAVLDVNSYIYQYAFSYCTGLEGVAVSGALTNVSNNAFDNCTSLKNVLFEGTTALTSIGVEAFKGCTSLDRVVLPSTVSYIADYAFDGCEKLSSINLNNTKITNVSIGCFRNCGIKNIKLPDTVTYIKNLAFANCKNLDYFEISANVGSFGSNVFTNAVINTLAVYGRNLNFDSTGLSSATIGKIKGFSSSTAETYALANNIPFVEIGSDEDDDTSKFSGTISLNNFDNAHWYITDSNELVFEGEGAITGTTLFDESAASLSVFDTINTYQINTIIFSEGITSIPKNFVYKENKTAKCLNNISLPSTLTYIGNNAFMHTGLDSLVIPENVTNIGSCAFYDAGLAGGVTINAPIEVLNSYVFYSCDFESFVIPDTVTTVWGNALNECRNLKLVVIPESVKTIGTDVSPDAIGRFKDTDNKLKNVPDLVISCAFGSVGYTYAVKYNFNIDAEMYGDYISGYFTTDNIAQWYYYPDTKNLYVIPDFNNSVIAGISNDFSKYSSIDVYYDADEYEYKTLSNGTTTENVIRKPVELGDLDVDTVYYTEGCVQIFGEKNNGEAHSLLYPFNPKHIVLANSVQNIRNYSFAGLTRLEEIVLPAKTTNYLYDYAFADSSIKKIDLSQLGVLRLRATMFDNCTQLETVILSEKSNVISTNAFKNCTSLKYINLDRVTQIGDYAFYQCTSLEGITIPYSVTSIGKYAFAKCTNVRYIDLYADTVSLGACSFANLPMCDTINIHSTYKMTSTSTSSKYQPFKDCGAMTTGVHIYFTGEYATKADLRAFSGNITDIHFGQYVGDFIPSVIPSLERITVDESNETLFEYNNCLYERYESDGLIFLLLAPCTMTEVEIYQGTTDIDRYAFSSSKIKNITVPEGVEYIYQRAFSNCTELRKVNLPTTLEYIEMCAFSDCTKLRIVSIPSCADMDSSVFRNCTNLASIVLPKNLEIIPSSAFRDCKSLKCIVIPEACTDIYNYAFYNCDALTDVYMFETDFESNVFELEYIGNDFENYEDDFTIHTMVGSVSYQRAIEYGYNVDAYTDEDIFRDECAMMEDIFEGYIGFCGDEHGDIEYLTVYEPSCTQDGYIVGVCEYCSVILEEKHIQACGHNYENTVFIPATATTQSVAKYECKNCGDVYCVYSPPLSNDTQKVNCRVTGQVVIANDKSANTGSTPLANVSVQLDGETIATTNSEGRFYCNLETGVYNLVLHYNYGFDRELYLVVTDENIDITEEYGVIPIIACDWNKDGVIDDDDYSIFRFVIGSTKGSPAYLDFVDMNNDGKINVKDLVYMNNVKGLNSETYRYPSVIIGA